MLSRIFVWLSGLVLVLTLGALAVPYTYLAELVLSFLPYMIIVHLFLLGYWLGKLWVYRRWFVIVFVILHVVGGIYFSRQYIHFYQADLDAYLVASGVNDMTVLYANILKDNDNYSGLLVRIDEYKPDILFLVEFADHHDEALSDFLKQNYPYINRSSWSSTFVGNMIFSKYPMSRLESDFEAGEWRYDYFVITVPGKNYYTYMVHTSAPDTYRNFVARNRHLDRIASDFDRHQGLRSSDSPVILLGDFNVSPWSAYYKEFAEALVLNNITRHMRPLFTRTLPYLPVLRSHIDHIWYGGNLSFVSIEKIPISGSDHDGFVFKIR